MTDEKQRPSKRAKRHAGTFESIGGRWQRLILYCDGKRHTFRLDSFGKKTSEQFARDKYKELLKQLDRARRGVDGTTRFSELLAQYKRDELPTLADGTQRAYADSFRPFTEYFVDELGDPSLEKIGSREVKGFLAWRRVRRRAGKNNKPSAEPVSNRTLQKDRAVLHRLFDFAYRLELIDGNAVARVEQPKADPRSAVILSDEQFEALLTKCADRPQLWLYTLTLNEMGGRAYSEALHLQWPDVDLAEGFIEVRSGARVRGEKGHRTKSGKSRFVPMTPRLLQAMKDHFARRRFATYEGKPSLWIFHHEMTRRGSKAGDRVKSFRQAFDKAATAAGIPDTFHRHDLRHRCVTTWLAAGANPVHVKEAMGHSDLRTTMGYTHLSKEHLRALVTSAATAISGDTAEKGA